MGSCFSDCIDPTPQSSRRTTQRPHRSFIGYSAPGNTVTAGPNAVYTPYPPVPAAQYVYYTGFPPLPPPTHPGEPINTHDSATLIDTDPATGRTKQTRGHSVAAFTLPTALYYPPTLGPFFSAAASTNYTTSMGVEAPPPPYQSCEVVGNQPKSEANSSARGRSLASEKKSLPKDLRTDRPSREPEVDVEPMTTCQAAMEGPLPELPGDGAFSSAPDSTQVDYSCIDIKQLSENKVGNIDADNWKSRKSKSDAVKSAATVRTHMRSGDNQDNPKSTGGHDYVAGPAVDSIVGMATSLVGAKIWEYQSRHPSADVTKRGKYYSVVETNYIAPGSEDPEIDFDRLNEFLETQDSYGFVSRIRPFNERYPPIKSQHEKENRVTQNRESEKPQELKGEVSTARQVVNPNAHGTGQYSDGNIIVVAAAPAQTGSHNRPAVKRTQKPNSKSASAIVNRSDAVGSRGSKGIRSGPVAIESTNRSVSLSIWEDCNSTGSKARKSLKDAKHQLIKPSRSLSAGLEKGYVSDSVTAKQKDSIIANRDSNERKSSNSKSNEANPIKVTVLPSPKPLRSNLVKRHYDIRMPDANGRILLNIADLQRCSDPIQSNSRFIEIMPVRKSQSHDAMGCSYKTSYLERD